MWHLIHWHVSEIYNQSLHVSLVGAAGSATGSAELVNTSCVCVFSLATWHHMQLFPVASVKCFGHFQGGKLQQKSTISCYLSALYCLKYKYRRRVMRGKQVRQSQTFFALAASTKPKAPFRDNGYHDGHCLCKNPGFLHQALCEFQ